MICRYKKTITKIIDFKKVSPFKRYGQISRKITNNYCNVDCILIKDILNQ